MLLMVIGIVAVLLLCWVVFNKKVKVPSGLKSLPCENGIPVLGVLPLIKGALCNYFWNLSKRHGPIFKCRLGMRDMVVISNFSLLNKSMKINGDVFSGRWRNKLIDMFNRHSGIVNTDGHVWATQRSFVLKVLKDFGLGKAKSNEIVQRECEYLLNELKDLERKRVNFAEIIPIYTANIISKFIMNKRFSREEPNIKFIQQFMTELVSSRDWAQIFFLMFPWLGDNWIVCKMFCFLNSRLKVVTLINDYFRKEVLSHLKELDLHCEGNDLIDRYLMEREETIKKLGCEDTFTEFQIIKMSIDLFVAGFETTSTTLCWSMMFLSKFPEIQEDMFKEIENVIGTERMAVMNDKTSLPLTQAFMDEVLRVSSVAPLALIHRVMDDTDVDGYFISKDTLVFPNLFACHRDSDIWEKPFDFYPQHFLDVSDNGEMKYRHRKELIPFGIGKRQCLGESLARMEFFIFLVSIVQRFRVRFGDSVTEDMYRNALNSNDGLIRHAKLDTYIFDRR